MAALEPGLRVGVHVNLHRGDLSVNYPPTGRVAAHVPAITLDGVEFRVQPSCLRSMRGQGRRAVCAYAVGTIAGLDPEPDTSGLVRVTFKPFDDDTFTVDRADTVDPGLPVLRAGRVTFARKAGWVARRDLYVKVDCPACGDRVDTYAEAGRLLMVSHRDPSSYPAWCEAGSDKPAP
jgi:hypothetical protein